MLFPPQSNTLTSPAHSRISSVFYATASALILGFTACSDRTQNELSETIYEVDGLIQDLALEDASLIIQHEDIPGYMPSMTMPFNLSNVDEAKNLQVGDAIRFEFVVEETNSSIRNLKKINPSELDLPERPAPQNVKAKHVVEGDNMPTFNLIDQSGNAITLDTFEGKQFVLTFIFTRCAMPEFCPLMSSRFAKLESLIRDHPNLLENTRLLSISIDPEYDTPKVLADYADRYTEDSDFWRFATGDSEEVAKLTKAFRVYTETAGGTLNHGLCTALIDTDGTVRAIWRGSVWEPEAIFESLSKTTTP